MGKSHIATIAIYRHTHFPAMAQSAILSIPAVAAAMIPTIYDMGKSHIAHAGIIAGASRIPLRGFLLDGLISARYSIGIALPI